VDDGLQPGFSALDRLVELTREVDFAAFVSAQDEWTTKGASPEAASGEASPRDNVVFEAGLFGGALGIRRTFILHASGAKLPTVLLGLTSIRYDPDTTLAIVRQMNQKLRKRTTRKARSAAWRETDGNCPLPPERSSSRLRSRP
jgi:predicted nucleotide-binding protein